MQHAKQSAWPYIKKTAYVVQMNEFYVGGKPREAVCIIICLISKKLQKIQAHCSRIRKLYQMIVLSIVVLDICLLETFPLG
jgi:hypothetical protein